MVLIIYLVISFVIEDNKIFSLRTLTKQQKKNVLQNTITKQNMRVNSVRNEPKQHIALITSSYNDAVIYCTYSNV